MSQRRTQHAPVVTSRVSNRLTSISRLLNIHRETRLPILVDYLVKTLETTGPSATFRWLDVDFRSVSR